MKAGNLSTKNATHLDGKNCEKVASLGFEPKQTESKSVVLPLHHEAIVVGPVRGEKDNHSSHFDKHEFAKK